MRALSFLVLVMIADCANGICSQSTKTLLLVEVLECQSHEVHAKKKRPVGWNSTASGTLISGHILKRKDVLDRPGPHDEVHVETILPLSGPVTFFVGASAASTCNGVSPDEAWFISAGLCCDTSPRRGLCIAQRRFPVMKKAKRTDWHEYTPLR